MTASPEIVAAFNAWSVAELAAHFAAPCPNEVMDYLTDAAGERYQALAALPAANADDCLLKIMPLVLAEWPAAPGAAPLVPQIPHLVTELRRCSPELDEVMKITLRRKAGAA